MRDLPQQDGREGKTRERRPARPGTRSQGRVNPSLGLRLGVPAEHGPGNESRIRRAGAERAIGAGRAAGAWRVGAALALELQLATRRPWVPGSATLRRWARAAHAAGLGALPLRQRRVHAALPNAPSLCVRIVGSAESRRLDRDYRGKDRPTNVLSFPASPEERVASGVLGDLVICAPVVAREAHEQRKALGAHWAHMIVHGTLHLLGFDHERKRDARAMEALEVEILRSLGFHDPYQQSPNGPYE